MVADYVHRQSDLIASYEGLKRRRAAAAVIRERDLRAGLTTIREPTNREIKTEVLHRMCKELESIGSRGLSLAQLISTIPTSSGTSRKKLRSKVRLFIIQR